jgi:UDP-N-acetylglucosamine--N-acetylmuramyl-(pentapeptide) pyrophosphoryl-undecaprenol N-acetylglucosamine transferase
MSTNNRKLTRCFVAGRSGGHIIPCLTLAQQWKATHPQGRVLFIGTDTPLDHALTTHTVVDQKHLYALGNAPWRNPLAYPRFFYQLFLCIMRSYIVLKKERPERIISTGSYIAIPVVCAAYVLRIPIELWELNAEPGRTIKLLAPLATNINTCFTEAQAQLPTNTCVLSEYPLRYRSTDKISQVDAHKQLHLASDRVTIFILGGSQGSAELNAIIAALINNYPELAQKIQCIHQTGTQDKTNWPNWYNQQKIPALVFTYQDNLAPYFCAADIVLSRAGAGGIFETAFFGKKTIFMPLQTRQTSHQLKNALAQVRQHPQQCVMGTDQQTIVDLLRNKIIGK